MILLDARGISMHFGGIAALQRVNFTVDKHSITAIIGPNGAGKTTVFNCLTGFYKPTAGQLLYHHNGRIVDLISLLGEPFQSGDFTNPTALLRRIYYKFFGGTHLINRHGVARTFQNVRLFREMTVLENLLVAQQQRVNRNLLAGVARTKNYLRSEKEAVARSFSWLEWFGLQENANRLAGELPYGAQRRLEIARAMCTEPRLLCLDEPAAGLNPSETETLSHLIQQLRSSHGVTILLIEHDMRLVMQISDQVVVMDHGEVIATGTPDSVRQNQRVIEAYLGLAEEAS